jgi:hypothetical protein
MFTKIDVFLLPADIIVLWQSGKDGRCCGLRFKHTISASSRFRLYLTAATADTLDFALRNFAMQLHQKSATAIPVLLQPGSETRQMRTI